MFVQASDSGDSDTGPRIPAMKTPPIRFRLRSLLCAMALVPGIALAALSDEIQVYTDDINAPREFGLELHVNTTPSGRGIPDYAGEAVPAHGLRRPRRNPSRLDELAATLCACKSARKSAMSVTKQSGYATRQ